MNYAITPVLKQSLADNLASELRNFIIKQNYLPGDRLPSTTELAQRFGVGLPTLREALKKLETTAAITIKHGSGIYVGEHVDSIFLVNPIISQDSPTQKQLLDLIEARIPIELSTVALAAEHATDEQVKTMEELLQEAREYIENDSILNRVNMAFHRQIALASGNAVFHQILSVITGLFQKEQRLIIDIFRSKEIDHEQHVEIFNALQARDKELAVRKMRSHLSGVRDAIMNWNPSRE